MDVEDSPALKLVIMRVDDKSTLDDILENKGDHAPRIYRNSVLFLCPSDGEKMEFTDHLKSKIALKRILTEINLGSEQKKNVEDELRKEKSVMEITIKRYYRTLYVPNKNGYEVINRFRDGYITQHLTSVDVEEVVRTGGVFLEFFEGFICDNLDYSPLEKL